MTMDNKHLTIRVEDVLPKGSAGYERGQRLKDAVIHAKNYVCIERALLATQAYKMYACEPIAVKRAKVFAHILENMRVYILPDELIVGHQAERQRSAPIFPEFAVDWVVNEIDKFETRPQDKFIFPEENKKLFLEEVVPYFKGNTLSDRAYAVMPESVRKLSHVANQFELGIHEEGGFGHLILDFGLVLQKGFAGLRKEAQDHLDSLDMCKAEDIRKHAFYESCVITCDAVITFARRYSEEAKRMAEEETDAKRKAELLEIARVCSRVPEHPAEDFHEALQSFWFTQLLPQIYDNGVSISPGRFDQYMYPYYEKDVLSGKRSREECQELLECTWVKFVEPMKLQSAAGAESHAGFPMGQNLIIGGIDRDGNDATNDLSYRVLEAHRKMLLMQPNFSVRLHNDAPEEFVLAVCDAVRRGNGMPQLVNDHVFIRGLMNIGVSLEDARDYALEGCVESTPLNAWGRGNGGYFNHTKVMELTLNNGRCAITGEQVSIQTGDAGEFKTVEEFKEAYQKQMAYCVRQLVMWNNMIDHIHEELMPVPLVSMLTGGCMESGKDVTQGGAKYNWTGPPTVGIANVGNSAYTIFKLIFEDGKYTMRQLVDALQSNWENDEFMRQFICNRVAKYGNDEEGVDKATRWAIDTYLDESAKYETYRGGPFIGGLVPVSSYVHFGQCTGATPDGRKRGEPLADGISPANGTDLKGLTAVLKSATKLNHFRCQNGVILNVKLNPLTVSTDDGLKKLAQLIKTYMDLNGEHIQFNVVTAETLRDAQAHPEEYKSLVVRVAGYSAFYNELSKEVQDSIIARTENCL